MGDFRAISLMGGGPLRPPRTQRSGYHRSMVTRVVLDANAVDPLIDDPGVAESLDSAISAGQLEVFYPHITLEELAAVADLDRRVRLLLALVSVGKLVPTGAFVLGASRLGLARLGGDTVAFDGLRSNRTKHTNDALIAVTAQMDGCTLVTNDERLRKRATESGISVLTVNELVAAVPGDDR